MTGHHEHHPAENPYAGQGPVLLDIGGDVGALVVRMPAAASGREVEIRPTGRVPTAHVAVVDRPVAGGPLPSLVFPELAAGDYELCWKGQDQALLAVQVTGGAVTGADWPADW